MLYIFFPFSIALIAKVLVNGTPVHLKEVVSVRKTCKMLKENAMVCCTLQRVMRLTSLRYTAEVKCFIFHSFFCMKVKIEVQLIISCPFRN